MDETVQEKNKLPRIVSLGGKRKLINACKKAGLPLHNPIIRYNSYGAEYGYKSVTLSTIGDVRKYNKIRRELNEIQKSPKKTINSEERVSRWCNRLSKLTGIFIEEAKEIAKEKIEYALDNVERRFASAQTYEPRGTMARYPLWVNQANRDYSALHEDESKALIQIKDGNHAHNILSAHHRHQNTKYESLLDEAKELAQVGEIDKSEVRDYARRRL